MISKFLVTYVVDFKVLGFYDETVKTKTLSQCMNGTQSPTERTIDTWAGKLIKGINNKGEVRVIDLHVTAFQQLEDVVS